MVSLFYFIIMQKFYIYQDIENCYYCTAVESKLKNWTLVGTFIGSYTLKNNNDFEVFEHGAIIELTNGKRVQIEEITWKKVFTIADFKNFEFKYGQVVLLKDGSICKLNGVSFNLEMYEGGNLLDLHNTLEGNRFWVSLDEVVNIYTPKPIDISKYGIFLQ